MDDLIKRLTDKCTSLSLRGIGYGSIDGLLCESAEELTRLRAERAELVEALERADRTLQSFLMHDHPTAVSIRALLARIGEK